MDGPGWISAIGDHHSAFFNVQANRVAGGQI
jgi:hypothetical protein